MSVDLGSIYSSLNLRLDQFESNITKAVDGFRNIQKEAAEASKKMDSDMSAALKRTGNEATTLTSKFKLLTDEYDKNRKQMELMTKTGDSMKSIGTTMTYSVTAPVIGLGTAAAKTAIDFEAGMSKVKAISGATGDELKILNDQAIRLGADTVFSAKEAAEGMQNLASAGFNVNEIYSAMPGMLSLAASGDIEIADAADIASSALRGFGLEASQSGHVADVLAKAAADTNANVTDMGYSLKYAAAPAHALGLSLEETAAAIGVMANAGIKGEQAGTTLRGALTRLVNPSEDAAKTMDKLSFSAFDNQGKMKSLSTIVGEFSEKTKNLTDEQKQQAIANIFGQESMSGMLVLLDQGKDTLDELTTSFKNSDGAATDMANTMQDNTKGALEQMKGSLETAGIKLGTVLAPAITEIANDVTELANKFSQLNPETQTTIVKTLALAAAMGPVVMVSGSMISGFSKIVAGGRVVASIMGIVTTATAEVGAASAAATGVAGAGGLVGLGGSFAGLIAAAAPWLLGAVAVAGTGYLIYKAMTQEAVPAVNLFGDAVQTTGGKVMNANVALAQGVEGSYVKISDATKKAVGAYMKLDDEATAELTNLYVNGGVVTDKIVTSLVTKYNNMGIRIKTGLDKNYNDQYGLMNTFFQKSGTLTETEEAEIIKKMGEANADKKAVVDQGIKRIDEIMRTASNEKRELYDWERRDILNIQNQMKADAVGTLSQSEQEQAVIMGRIKDYGTRMSAEQASDIIKKAEEQRLGVVDKANLQYKQTVSAIEYQRDVTKTITADQATAMIADAEKQRSETIAKADDQKRQVVEKITGMNADIGKSVDLTTGTMITNWDKFATGVGNAITTAMGWITKWNEQHIESKTGTMTITQYTKALTGMQTSGPNAGRPYASGTDYATRGWHLVGEEGPEIRWFDGGEKVLNANDTKSVLSAFGSGSAFNGASLNPSSWYSAGIEQGIDADIGPTKRTSNEYNNKSITQNITIN
ncbi:MAG: phage tail tape measure protein, partial [Clostridiaceae bacterium]